MGKEFPNKHFIAVLFLLFILGGCIQKEAIKTNVFPAPIGYVNDFDSLLTVQQVNDLGSRIKQFNEETSNQICIVTLNSLYSYNTALECAIAIGNEYGVGEVENDNGLILLVCNNERVMAIATGLETEKILSASFCSKIIDEYLTTEFRNDKMYDGISKGLDEIIREWSESQD